MFFNFDIILTGHYFKLQVYVSVSLKSGNIKIIVAEVQKQCGNQGKIWQINNKEIKSQKHDMLIFMY